MAQLNVDNLKAEKTTWAEHYRDKRQNLNKKQLFNMYGNYPSSVSSQFDDSHFIINNNAIFCE